MTKEFFWLTLTIILTGVLWFPYVLDRIKVRGLMGSMTNPSRTDTPQSPWAQRLYFAHTNAVDNLVIFAPLVLMLDNLGYSSRATVIACAVYFWARLVHAVVYAVGSQTDRRRSLIRITPLGLAALSRADRTRAATVVRLMREFSLEEAVQLADGLQHLVGDLERSLEAGARRASGLDRALPARHLARPPDASCVPAERILRDT
jgi:uncharacterized MAPEG superfamily protein